MRHACAQAGTRPAPETHLPKTLRRQRAAALALIAKHAGAYADDARRTRWVVDLVARAAAELTAAAAARDAEAARLEAEVARLAAAGAAAEAAAAAEAGALRARVAELEKGQYDAGFALHTAQRERHEMRLDLEAAERAAAAASAECAALAGAARRAGEQDARVRRAVAVRSHALRAELLEKGAALRAARASDRRMVREAELRLRAREAAVDAERAAVAAGEDAAAAREALLEDFALRLHVAETRLAAQEQQQQQQQTQTQQTPKQAQAQQQR